MNNTQENSENKVDSVSAGSILDKVMQANQSEREQVDLVAVIDRILQEKVSEREHEIIRLRHGLAREVHTLEQIGRKFSLTRERVRQIVNQVSSKIAKVKNEIEELKQLDRQLRATVEASGGFRTHASLLQDYFNGTVTPEQTRYLEYFLQHLSDYLIAVPGQTTGWQVVGVPLELLSNFLKLVKTILTDKKEPIADDKLLEFLSEQESFINWQTKYSQAWSRVEGEIVWSQVLAAYLELADGIDQNPFQEWGLTSWPTIKPRRMADKIHLVLQRHGEPLHFKDITRLINEHGFDGKTAHAPTVHNELILDDRFVLIGRGIYALAERGYQAGTVVDVLESILRGVETPVAREDLVRQVLTQRRVKAGTVILALNDRQKFSKMPDGRYTIVNNTEIN